MTSLFYKSNNYWPNKDVRVLIDDGLDLNICEKILSVRLALREPYYDINYTNFVDSNEQVVIIRKFSCLIMPISFIIVFDDNFHVAEDFMFGNINEEFAKTLIKHWEESSEEYIFRKSLKIFKETYIKYINEFIIKDIIE